MLEFSAQATTDCLGTLGWLPVGRSVASVAIAGAGNMNLVERVTLDDGSTLILKRAMAGLKNILIFLRQLNEPGLKPPFTGPLQTRLPVKQCQSI